MIKSILVTGCNRGLGLGLVKNLAKDGAPPRQIIATCRDIRKAQELRDISEHHKNVHIIELDVTNFASYAEFVRRVEDVVNENGLNVLINNAGISTKFARLPLVKAEQMAEAYSVNVVAPVMLTKVLHKMLKLASSKRVDRPLGCERALVVNMSSVLGSNELNDQGGYYPYRCSKAALNMATKSMSVDLKSDGILAVSVHPGWVKTDMGGRNATMEVDESTGSIAELIKSLNESHNGGFYQWDGKRLAW